MLVGLCEMCIAGKLGADIKAPNSLINLNEYFFAEDQSRYIIEISENNYNDITKILDKNSVFFEKIGITQKDRLVLKKEFDISVEELKKANNSWFSKYMS